MEITNALLVALMFITILSIGIGNILTAIASFLDHREAHNLDWLAASWILMVLLMHLHLFWETLEILSVEKWGFLGFLYVVLGPMLLLISSRFLLENPDPDVPTFSRQQYRRVSRRFFSMMAIVMLWLIGIDFVLVRHLTPDAIVNVIAFVILLALSASKNERLHTVATVAIWVLVIVIFVLRSLRSPGVT